MVTFKVRNTESNKNVATFNNLMFSEVGKMLEIKISPLCFPYLQSNVNKIKKAIGF